MSYILFALCCFGVLVFAAVLFTKRNDVDPSKLQELEKRIDGMDTKVEDSRDKAMFALGRSDSAFNTVKELENKAAIIQGIVEHIASHRQAVDVNVHYSNRKPLLPPAPPKPREPKSNGRMMDRAKHGDESMSLPLGASPLESHV